MPNKRNAPRRRHIPEMKFRVKNRSEYDIVATGMCHTDMVAHDQVLPVPQPTT
jgi:Zn-dependent alcohol dehydrogenase